MFTEMATGGRFAHYGSHCGASSGFVLTGQTSGQDCCDMCSAQDCRVQYVSYKLPGHGSQCYCTIVGEGCDSNTLPRVMDTPGQSLDFGRGTCAPPEPYVFTQLGTGQRFQYYTNCGGPLNGFQASGTYTTGQECCDLCAAQGADVKWASYKLAGDPAYGTQCYCTKTGRSGGSCDPSLTPNTVGSSSNFGRGSCLPQSTGRKKRDLDKRTMIQHREHMNDRKLLENQGINRKRRQAAAAAAVPEVETEEELEIRSYGSRLRYECGLARRFYDVEAYEGEDPFYDERWMQCNWNNSWTLYDSLDDCVWTQCINPPDPPAAALIMSTWSGDPVDFYDNVSYVCAGENLFFEWDREMVEFNVSCLPGGAWDNPIEWPICLPCKILNSENILL